LCKVQFGKDYNLKSLVVYYSRTGNPRFVAETIAAEIGADIEEIIDQKKRNGAIGFLIGGFDAIRGKETEIAPTKKSPIDYDLMIVGTPVWAGRLTPAITTYLKKTNLSEQRVAVFFTQDGKKTPAIDQIKALMPNSEFIGEISIIKALDNKKASEKQIADWCIMLANP
jgi:flavodoxin